MEDRYCRDSNRRKVLERKKKDGGKEPESMGLKVSPKSLGWILQEE